MSESPELSWTTRAEVAAAVDRGIALQLDPLRAQVATMVQTLATLAARAPEVESALVTDRTRRDLQAADLRQAVAAAIEQGVARMEAAHVTESSRAVAEMAALVATAETEGQRRDTQVAELLAAIDQRLEALHAASTKAGEARDQLLSVRIETAGAERGKALLDRIDQRTAGLADLEEIPAKLAEIVYDVTTAALAAQIEPIVTRLSQTADGLAEAGGMIQTLAAGHADAVRAIEDRVADMLTKVAERAEKAVDRSRARVAEGQVALGARMDGAATSIGSDVKTASDHLATTLANELTEIRTLVATALARPLPPVDPGLPLRLLERLDLLERTINEGFTTLLKAL